MNTNTIKITIRDFFTSQFFLTIIACIVFMTSISIASYIENNYTMSAEVVEINSDFVTLEDTTGNLWEVEAADLNLGDKVTAVFDKNNTENRTDDKITNIKLIK